MCFMGNSLLLCMQCKGIGPHLVPRGKSHGFSQGAAGTWGIFSSNNGDGPSKLEFVQRCQDSCLVARDTSGLFSRLGRAIGTPLKVRMEKPVPFQLPRDMGIPINFQEESVIVSFGSIELHIPLEVSKGCEASCRDKAGNLGFV